jgi:hypothetical protein
MDASQLAAANHSLIDTELRKQRSPSLATHVSSVVADANTRLAVTAAAADDSTRDLSAPASAQAAPASKILASIVNRYDNLVSMVYIDSPPTKSFGPVSNAEKNAVSSANTCPANAVAAADDATSDTPASTSASTSAFTSKSAPITASTSAPVLLLSAPTNPSDVVALFDMDKRICTPYSATNRPPAEDLSTI